MRCDATTTANKANGARLTAPQFFNKPRGRGKELKRLSPRHKFYLTQPRCGLVLTSYYAGSV